MKKTIIDEIKLLLQEKPEIKFAYLFGSFLTDDDFQDIDIAVYLDQQFLRKIDILKYEFSLSLSLEDLIKPGNVFKRLVAIDVKVINPGNIPVSLRYSISKGLLLFSRDDEIREEFICGTWKEYFDFQYVSDKYFQEVTNASI